MIIMNFRNNLVVGLSMTDTSKPALSSEEGDYENNSVYFG